jgi:nitroimidazol reductase NimA-like FMN-containing flavoprotein (pyridoxamine 5'-phosphate oxidase superfamily)
VADALTLPQGDTGLLATATAQTLLRSTIPARLAYVATDGTPRIVPTWFTWTGREIVMGTYVRAPHVSRPAARIRAIRANPAVAVSIDTEGQPPQVLSIRGQAVVTEHPGAVAEYAEAAHRYLGDEMADVMLGTLDESNTVMARIAVEPEWVGLIDFETRLPQPLGGVLGDAHA